MSNTNIEKMDELITFSEAKKRFIEDLEKEIEVLHNKLRDTFLTYANQINAYEQNLLLSLDFDDTIYRRNRLHRLFFVIESLKKLDRIVTISRTINKKTNKIRINKPIKYIHFRKDKNPNLYFKITPQEVKNLNRENEEYSKLHWDEKIKIKYSYMQLLGDAIINKKKEKFYDLLNNILENKEQTGKYTKEIFGTSIKNRTKTEEEQRKA